MPGRARRRAAPAGPVEGPWALPEGWRWERLGDFLNERGRTFEPSKAPNETVELYSVPSFDSGRPEIVLAGSIGSSKQHVQPGEVLLCKINPRINRAWVVGRAGQYRQIASTEWIRFRVSEYVEPEYLQRFLSTELVRSFLALNVSGVGGSLMRVKGSVIADHPIPLAPPDVQRAIVARIDALFAEIGEGEAALRRARDGVETWRRSLLKAAVTGELTADWRAQNPPTETGEALLARILADRRTRWLADPRNARKPYKPPTPPDTTNLPTLPEGWTWANLDQLSTHEVRNGLSVKDSAEPTQVRALRLGALATEQVDWEVFRYLPRSQESVEVYRLEHGDMLVSRANGSPDLVGKAALALNPPRDMIFPDTAIRFRPVCDLTISQWIVSVWNSMLVRHQIGRLAKTTAGILKISQTDITRIAIPLPSSAEIAATLAIVQAQLRSAPSGEDLSGLDAAAATLRQSILAAAFRGELVA